MRINVVILSWFSIASALPLAPPPSPPPLHPWPLIHLWSLLYLWSLAPPPLHLSHPCCYYLELHNPLISNMIAISPVHTYRHEWSPDQRASMITLSHHHTSLNTHSISSHHHTLTIPTCTEIFLISILCTTPPRHPHHTHTTTCNALTEVHEAQFVSCVQSAMERKARHHFSIQDDHTYPLRMTRDDATINKMIKTIKPNKMIKLIKMIKPLTR